MKFSLNTIRFYRDMYNWSGDPVPDGPEALAQKIGAQLGGIEEIIDVGPKYQGALIVKVVSCVDHRNADRLHVCRVDDGGKAQGVERDEQGHVQVVCGAPNVHEGMLAVWLPPGVIVPSTYGKEPFAMESREIRGQKSNGMLASPKELAISDAHEGILEVVLDSDEHILPGTPFAAAYHLDGDVVFDIENKMFTHRPDCFGFLGIARELAGIQGQAFKSPDWYRLDSDFPAAEAEPLPLTVRNELPALVPRFMAIALRDVRVGPSPVWLQLDLARVGLRPINNIVDYTNYFMLETGQPLHAYDYDKVKALSGDGGAALVVRQPKPGEKLTLLNGKTIEPRPETIMIATDRQPIGVGGVMGGGETEVDGGTRNIILECANFDMYSIRRTSMAHGLFTDAVTRFNKGQSPLQNPAVLAKIVDEIRQFVGGKVASELIDDNHVPAETLRRGSVHPPVIVSTEFINARLGLKLTAEEMKTLLTNVEFQVAIKDAELTVTAPFWRTDIELREDVVEEVGRLYGYDKLPLELPRRDVTPATKDPLFELKYRIRQALSKAGANEVLTYSFVHGKLLDKVGQDKTQAFQISNALSPDLQYYRLSLTPSLLDKVHPNIKAGYGEFALFEIGKTHDKTTVDDNGLPVESDGLALVYASQTAGKAGAAYYQARQFLTSLAGTLGVELEFEPLASHARATDAPFAPQRSAVIHVRGHDQGFGVIGEFNASVLKALKLPPKCASFEIDLNLFDQANLNKYVQLPRFPKVEQDICLKVTADMPYQQLFNFVNAKLDEFKPNNSLLTLSPIDIYQRDDDHTHKQITLRLSIANYERTLTDAEVNKLLDRVATAAKAELSAERI